MIRRKTIEIDGRSIEAKELTVAQVKEILETEDSGPPDTIDMLFFDRLPSAAVRASTGLNAEDLEQMAPGDIEKVLEAVEGVNPIFARLIRKAAGEAERMLSTAASAG